MRPISSHLELTSLVNGKIVLTSIKKTIPTCVPCVPAHSYQEKFQTEKHHIELA